MKILVNNPKGYQEIITVGEGGGYFDLSCVLWDENIDGPLPEITLGGMVRNGNSLEYDQTVMDASNIALLSDIKETKHAELAAYRYEREVGGITINGIIIKTDRESQSLIAGAKIYSDLNEAISIDWKGKSGWVTINRTTIIAISQAVAAHVQACFTNEKAHAEAITALTTAAEIEAYDFTTGWPG